MRINDCFAVCRWVASEWLPDIGLPQYTETFLHSLVDARMLDTLSKKELEKFLSVTRKFHQASIVHGMCGCVCSNIGECRSSSRSLSVQNK